MTSHAGFRRSCCGPRRLDSSQSKKIKAESMKQYQRSVARFIDYLDEVGISPNGAEEWDDMLVEYKNARSLTKGQFSNTLNCVEFFFPRYKPLRWAKQVADAMAVEADVQHTIPMLPNAANLIASKLALKGYATVGAMLVLQVTTGMRPSDGYRKLKPSHIHIPSDPKKPAVIRLGAKTGTKVKREQFAMIDQHAHADVILMLKRWISVTPPDQFLCDHGYDKVNSLLKETCAELGLGFSYTPHSPRAGFATKGVIDGKTTETIMTEGRWASRGSFIRYLDVVVAAQVQVQLELSQFESDMSLAALNMTSLLCQEPDAPWSPCHSVLHDPQLQVRRSRCSLQSRANFLSAADLPKPSPSLQGKRIRRINPAEST